MTWYGLKENGELIAVLPWYGNGKPSVYDFNWVCLTSLNAYTVVEVEIHERS